MAGEEKPWMTADGVRVGPGDVAFEVVGRTICSVEIGDSGITFVYQDGQRRSILEGACDRKWAQRVALYRSSVRKAILGEIADYRKEIRELDAQGVTDFSTQHRRIAELRRMLAELDNDPPLAARPDAG